MPSKLPLLVSLLLASLLLAANAAHADAASPAATPLAFEEELEFADEEETESEEEASECDEAEEEFADGELWQTELEEICDEGRDGAKATAAGAAPEECLLRSAHASAVVNDKTDKLKLTIGYTTYEPVNAKIKVGNIATLQRHLGRSGVLRMVKDLHKDSKRLVVQIKLPSVKRAGCPSRRLVLFPR